MTENSRRVMRARTILSVALLVVLLRTLVCEVYLVETVSMEPSILPVEVFLVDKATFGASLPRRLSEVPLLNALTRIGPIREVDARTDWGYHRFPSFRDPLPGDVILFHPVGDRKTVLVKRISCRVRCGDRWKYYVLGDNSGNSTDSRHFGLVPDSLVIGRALHVLYSWDRQAQGLKKFRWHRIGHNISRPITVH